MYQKHFQKVNGFPSTAKPYWATSNPENHFAYCSRIVFPKMFWNVSILIDALKTYLLANYDTRKEKATYTSMHHHFVKKKLYICFKKSNFVLSI